ncbi:hypothetical protein LSTR_LSTR002382 [Laodelphax striatellus]|uniref:BTB domain-containing protein n=1 Tax=Laodelphax striatellus TaxID=195883 RepID=A0A482X2B3_LAOST|nr:hypothetical protein LSTR_LSTR002382 [Laodelphax striatellus]
MNILGALIPCALQRSCWPGDERMTDRMGAAASTPPGDLSPHHHHHHSHHHAHAQSPILPSNTSEQLAVVVRDRKKIKTGFATLRKKFIRRRRSSKACDHGRVIRDVVSDWSALEIASLLEEYEALAALKDLSMQAELARPPAATFKQDLSTLYDFKYCTDVDLIFRGACFPVHRALLSARCPYFRDLLAGCPGYGARICLELRTPGVDVEMFSALLRYLYTGDISPRDGNIDLNLLRRLGEEFGTPNPLETDLRYLLETGDYADAALVFTSDAGGVGGGGGGEYPPATSSSSSQVQRPDSGSSEYGFRPKLELPCHKAILSARSPFFRNLIQRRTRSGEEHTERALHIPTRIVLDESVIPKRYARVLLHAIYLDTVDLSLILRGSGCGSSAGSLGEVEALTNTGRARPSPLEEAMELYQIGRFLELDIVSQGCEDVILEWLNLESLPGVLRWGSQPHGSAWVHRQARHYLREEFSSVVQLNVLYQLDKTHLIDALHSHFLQASELEILQAVLKWGEYHLIRRMEDREPNLLNHTAHSVARKGVKKRDLSDAELRELLADMLPLVRMDHVAPAHSDTLAQAIRRGLVSTPPSHMLGADSQRQPRDSSAAWVRTAPPSGLFVRPRLFMPYYEEIKTLLEDRLVQEVELRLRLRRARYIADIPDTLYMVEEKHGGGGGGGAGVDVLASAIPAPDAVTMAAMLKREQKLRRSPGCQRAIALPLSSRHEINRQIRLRVVREFNLPDQVADLLENTACYCSEEEEAVGGGLGGGTLMRGGSGGGYSRRPSPGPPHSGGGVPTSHPLPAIITEGGDLYHTHSHAHTRSGNDCCGVGMVSDAGEGVSGGGHLSDIMPDVAMAGERGVSGGGGQGGGGGGVMQGLHEQLEQLELDLGDGPPRLMTSSLYPHHRSPYAPPPPYHRPHHPPPPQRFI